MLYEVITCFGRWTVRSSRTLPVFSVPAGSNSRMCVSVSARVITSYSIHYTKLYDAVAAELPAIRQSLPPGVNLELGFDGAEFSYNFV